MPGPYGATDGEKLVMRAAYMPPLLAHRAEKLYTDTIIMYGWNEP